MSIHGDRQTRKRISEANCLFELARKKRKTGFRNQASQQINIARKDRYNSLNTDNSEHF